MCAVVPGEPLYWVPAGRHFVWPAMGALGCKRPTRSAHICHAVHLPLLVLLVLLALLALLALALALVLALPGLRPRSIHPL